MGIEKSIMDACARIFSALLAPRPIFLSSFFGTCGVQESIQAW